MDGRKISRKEWSLFLLAIPPAIILFLLTDPFAERQCDSSISWLVGLLLVSMLACFVIPTFALCSRNTARFWILLVLACGFVAAIGCIKWPKEKFTIVMNFKSSPLFTSQRKTRITHELNCFYIYLASLGFDFPKETPPLGTSKGISPGGFSSPGTVYEASIFFAEETIDIPAALDTRYAMYLFARQMVHQNGIADPFYSEMSWLFPCYYGSSFNHVKACSATPDINAWLDAFSEIRCSYGPEFTDKLMYHVFRTRQTTPSQENDFNSYFAGRVMTALVVLENSGEDRAKINAILKRHGLPELP
jgi:hypothetical protein